MVDPADVYARGGVRLFRANVGPVMALSFVASVQSLVVLALFLTSVIRLSTVAQIEEAWPFLTPQSWLLATGLIAPGAGAAARALPWRDWFAAARPGLVRSLVASLAVSATAFAAAHVHGALTAGVYFALVLVPSVAAVERRTALETLQRGLQLAVSHVGSIIVVAIGFLCVAGAIGWGVRFAARRVLAAVSGADHFWTVFCILASAMALVMIALQALLACLVVARYHAWRGPRGHDVARVFD